MRAGALGSVARSYRVRVGDTPISATATYTYPANAVTAANNPIGKDFTLAPTLATGQGPFGYLFTAPLTGWCVST